MTTDFGPSSPSLPPSCPEGPQNNAARREQGGVIVDNQDGGHVSSSPARRRRRRRLARSPRICQIRGTLHGGTRLHYQGDVATLGVTEQVEVL